MDKFSKICADIKSLKIQGAVNVAMAAVKALELDNSPSAIRKLVSLRPTEPCLRNAIRFVAPGPKKFGPEAIAHFKGAERKIAEYGSGKIAEGSVVFTHCHSSAVVAILKEVKRQGRKFSVMCTETRPMLQGRKTATELAAARIPVTMVVDSAARVALKKCDLMLIGADAITSEGRVANKIGSEMFALMAEKYDVPCYSCTDSWKLDPVTVIGKEEPIENRCVKEIWSLPPRGVKILNPAFEILEPRLIDGIISELGVYAPGMFVEKVRESYPWIFEI